MNRREFLQCAALLSAGATVVPRGWTLSQDQTRYLAARHPILIRQHRRFLLLRSVPTCVPWPI